MRVITSYSIHYTKLYDDTPPDLRDILQPVAVEVAKCRCVHLQPVRNGSLRGLSVFGEQTGEIGDRRGFGVFPLV